MPFPGTLTVSRGLTNILGSLFLSEIVGPNILINVSFIFLCVGVISPKFLSFPDSISWEIPSYKSYIKEPEKNSLDENFIAY